MWNVGDVRLGGMWAMAAWGYVGGGGFETWSLKHAHVWGKLALTFETYTNQPKEHATFTTSSTLKP
jgi:hypothetical protein